MFVLLNIFAFVHALSWGRTYIDKSSSYHIVLDFSFWDRTYIDRSLSMLVWGFLGPNLYRSVIHLVSLVFETTPISISHCLVSWVDYCSSSSRACPVESCSILSHISFFEFILFENWSFLILLIFESFIVSWSSVVHCIYTHRIVHISLFRVSPP